MCKTLAACLITVLTQSVTSALVNVGLINMQFWENRWGWNEIFAGMGGEFLGDGRKLDGDGCWGKLNLQGQLGTGVISVPLQVSNNYVHTNHNSKGVVFSTVVFCVFICVHKNYWSVIDVVCYEHVFWWTIKVVKLWSHLFFDLESFFVFFC